MQEIKEVDEIYANSPAPNLYKKRQLLQTELNLMYSADTATLLTQLKHKNYEYGEKSGTFWLNKLKKKPHLD